MDKRSMIAQMSARTGRPEMDYEDWSIGALASGLKTTPATNLGNITNVNPDDIRHIVREEIAGLDLRVDQSLIEQLIGERVNALSIPLTVELTNIESETRIEAVHHVWPKVMALASLLLDGNRRVNQWWYGAPGAGKSHTAKLMADALGLDFAVLMLMDRSPKSDIEGLLNPLTSEYRPSAFVKMFEHGGLMLIDEMDNCPAAVATVLNPALANGRMALPDGRLITRHPDFHVIAAANTAGRGGTRNHAARQQQDSATLDRFTFVEWEYDHALEDALVYAINPDAGWWVSWVREVRKWAAANAPHLIASPRTSQDGAQLLLLGEVFTHADIANMTLFKGLGADVVRNCLANCPLPQGGK